MDPKKLQALYEYLKPMMGKVMERFLGLVNWFHEYFKNYSMMTSTLDCARKTSGKIHWMDEMNATYEELHKKIMENIVLVYPDFDLPFHLFMDTSKTGLGAWLGQKKDGAMQIMSCISRSLNPAECNYSATKCEMLAVVWVLNRLQDYLLG